MPDTADRRRIVSRALAIGASVTPFGVAFGALATTVGLSALQTCLLSLVLFSGASQFALVSVLGAGGTVVAALATALLLGVRNGLYGMRVASLMQPRSWKRVLAAQVTIDESTAMAVAESNSGQAAFAFWVTAASVYVLWNLATLAGVIAGRALSSPSSIGLDAAGPAAFIALLGPRLRVRRHRRVAATSIVVALALVPWLPVGAPLLIGAAAGIAVFGLSKP